MEVERHEYDVRHLLPAADSADEKLSARQQEAQWRTRQPGRGDSMETLRNDSIVVSKNITIIKVKTSVCLSVSLLEPFGGLLLGNWALGG